jgi:NADPH:quinone reductase-like Zn-dependent oxidoreductase
MRAWTIPAGCQSAAQMQVVEQAMPEPGTGEVLIRVRACSINYRDQLIPKGFYFGGPVAAAGTPLSDGAGEIVAIGPDVSGFATGDRVAGLFFQGWKDGPPMQNPGDALGAPPAKGMLADYVVLPASGVIPMAASLTFEEAATLPCAGVTAWNALFCGIRPLHAGATVLLIGTGGVSLLALQIAKAAGARVIATSSSDEKLERMRALGADMLINYRTEPSWGALAASLAGGSVDHVVEVGGLGTLAQSIEAVGFGGEVSLIGVLTLQGDASPMPLMLKGASLRGIFVGSAQMASDLNKFIDRHNIKPAIDKVFDCADALAAYDYQASPDLFGKVVIANPD